MLRRKLIHVSKKGILGGIFENPFKDFNIYF